MITTKDSFFSTTDNEQSSTNITRFCISGENDEAISGVDWLFEINPIPDDKGRQGNIKFLGDGGKIIPFFYNVDISFFGHEISLHVALISGMKARR